MHDLLSSLGLQLYIFVIYKEREIWFKYLQRSGNLYMVPIHDTSISLLLFSTIFFLIQKI